MTCQQKLRYQGKPYPRTCAACGSGPCQDSDMKLLHGLDPRPDHPQPVPKANNHPAVWPLVLADMVARDKLGRERYGVPLQPHNGRDTLRDAYEEALDLAVYLRSALYERDGA